MAQPQAQPSVWQLDTAASELTVHVFKAGLFSGFLHDHLFVPGQWKATAKFDPGHLEDFHAEVSVSVASLKDNQQKLSAEDRAKVESQVIGPEVLDASRFPEIQFVADRLRVSTQKTDELEGTLSGKLSVHGVTRALDVPVHAWKRGNAQVVLGKVSFNQSDFGISPLSKAGGAISVEDRVLIDFTLRLVPFP
jgi:polyisoprenoid-binding protein YceI